MDLKVVERFPKIVVVGSGVRIRRRTIQTGALLKKEAGRQSIPKQCLPARASGSPTVVAGEGRGYSRGLLGAG